MKNHIDRAYAAARRLAVNPSSKIVLMSDCHRGNGSWGDNFAPNQNNYFAALRYYYRLGYTYIELGDGDELWENRRMTAITAVHSHVFWMLSRFFIDGRLIMLYGNHDIDKRRKSGLLDYYYDETECCRRPLLPGIKIEESVLLEASEGEMLLLHGHQADFFNDNLWRVSRALVRYLWRPLEGVGMKAPLTGAPGRRSHIRCEELLGKWSERNYTLVIAGHTHKPAFPAPGVGLYFNDGSCVHPRCITAIEIEDYSLTLVKWSCVTRHDGTLFIGRDKLAGPYPIADYFMKPLDNPPRGASLTDARVCDKVT